MLDITSFSLREHRRQPALLPTLSSAVVISKSIKIPRVASGRSTSGLDAVKSTDNHLFWSSLVFRQDWFLFSAHLGVLYITRKWKTEPMYATAQFVCSKLSHLRMWGGEAFILCACCYFSDYLWLQEQEHFWFRPIPLEFLTTWPCVYYYLHSQYSHFIFRRKRKR